MNPPHVPLYNSVFDALYGAIHPVIEDFGQDLGAIMEGLKLLHSIEANLILGEIRFLMAIIDLEKQRSDPNSI